MQICRLGPCTIDFPLVISYMAPVSFSIKVASWQNITSISSVTVLRKSHVLLCFSVCYLCVSYVCLVGPFMQRTLFASIYHTAVSPRFLPALGWSFSSDTFSDACLLKFERWDICVNLTCPYMEGSIEGPTLEDPGGILQRTGGEKEQECSGENYNTQCP